MKASIILAGASALFVSAGPVNHRRHHRHQHQQARDVVYETVEAATVTQVVQGPVVTDVVNEVVTVQGGQAQPKPAVKADVYKPVEQNPPVVVVSTVVTVGADGQPVQTHEAAKPSHKAAAKPKAKAKATKASTPEKDVYTKPSSSSSNEADDGGYLNPKSADYNTLMLHYHNAHRANHSVAKLTWNSKLASLAAVSAQECTFKHTQPQSGESINYGQNMAYSSNTSPNFDTEDNKKQCAAESVTDMWYNGEQFHWDAYSLPNMPTAELNSFSEQGIDLLHFTQMVWKASEEVGCATVWCPNGMSNIGDTPAYPAWNTFCNYYPRGNVEGEYGANVLKPVGLPMLKL